MYNRLNQIITQSPINPQRFVSYRGSQSMDYFESSRKLFRNIGFFSTTLMVRMAKAFSKKGYMTRIIVPEGYHCLYLESQTQWKGEYEILMPDQTQYFITSGFQEQIYGKDSIPTNELVMVQTNPKQVSTASLQSHHPIRDLLLDIDLRHEISRIANTLGLSRLDDIDHFSKIWLHRLVDHQIYTLEAFQERGIQLQPLVSEVIAPPSHTGRT